MRKGMRMALWLAVGCSLLACASDDWNNPRDPAGTLFSSCPGVDSDDADDCLVYEDFSGGLDRWFLSPRGDGLEPSVRTVDETQVLVLPACRDGDTAALRMELEVPPVDLFFEVVWRVPDDHDGPEGRVGVSLDGHTLGALAQPEGEWKYTRDWVDATTSGRSILRVYNRPHADGSCSEIHVDSLLVLGESDGE